MSEIGTFGFWRSTVQSLSKNWTFKNAKIWICQNLGRFLHFIIREVVWILDSAEIGTLSLRFGTLQYFGHFGYKGGHKNRFHSDFGTV